MIFTENFPAFKLNICISSFSGKNTYTQTHTHTPEEFPWNIHSSMYICVCVCVYIYIYIYSVCVCVCVYISEKAMAPHSSTCAWKIPWTEKPGRLKSMGSQRVRQDWATSVHFLFYLEQPGKVRGPMLPSLPTFKRKYI